MKIALAALCLIATPATAEPQCGDREIIAANLAERFGETPIGMGLSVAGEMVEVFASAKTGTWTLIASKPGGQSCLVTHGEGWGLGSSAPAGEAL